MAEIENFAEYFGGHHENLVSRNIFFSGNHSWDRVSGDLFIPPHLFIWLHYDSTLLNPIYSFWSILPNNIIIW